MGRKEEVFDRTNKRAIAFMSSEGSYEFKPKGDITICELAECLRIILLGLQGVGEKAYEEMRCHALDKHFEKVGQ